MVMLNFHRIFAQTGVDAPQGQVCALQTVMPSSEARIAGSMTTKSSSTNRRERSLSPMRGARPLRCRGPGAPHRSTWADEVQVMLSGVQDY